MIKIDFEYTTLAYKQPVPVRGAILTENTFLKVRLLEQDYYLSVLPHFHQVTLPELAFKIKHFFDHYSLDFSAIDFTKKFFNTTAIDHFLENINGETLFNIESLLLGILSQTHGHKVSNQKILINELYRPSQEIESYQTSACLKIKIAPGSEKMALDTIQKLYHLNPKMTFRLDGNRKFELKELISFYHDLEKNLPLLAFHQIDYFEEPLKNFYDTFLFQKRSKINIAIDESLPAYLKSNKLISPAVIKPSLIGLSPAMFLLRSRQDVRAIISSSFEHPTIMHGLYLLAAERPSEFHGLENFIK